ncbi:MAG: aminopeptidase [Clostridiaceae bacterium]|nr:aminopeptidase [Clostridiaceae bacterium]
MDNHEDKKSAVKELEEKLTFEFKTAWKPDDQDELDAIYTFAEDYKLALDSGKTEREFVNFASAYLEAHAFKLLDSYSELKSGDRVYQLVHGKGLLAAVIGENDPLQGFNLIGSHVDSPRLDLKPNPLYEASDLALMKTHYYGGIKKYHWVAQPLALHGVMIKKGGEKVEVSIGEDDSDPVLYISDLLPHLAADQMKKNAATVVEGEELNVLIGGLPYPDEDAKNRVKLAVLNLLFEKYGVTEREFLTAELEIVPAVKARDVGLDRSFLGAYGQDDRVCAYTSLRALTDLEEVPRRTALLLMYDKEEIGSGGNTGASSSLYPYYQQQIVRLMLDREPTALELSQNIVNSTMLSSDVTNAFDPTFASVSEPQNSCYTGRGMALNKYTGARGKGGTSDASAEYFDEVVRLLEDNDVRWQTGEMGKVDQGGGGTVAVYQAELGLEVIDCGVPLLSMHSCFEVSSKVDVYETYRGYRAFYENMRHDRV